jgi:hypothetical protein
VWSKRRWRCREVECPVKTWTERSVHVPPRALLTCRAGIEACRQVGELARPVSGVADELGVCWWTVMHAVERHGRPLVDDPARVGPVAALGVDETSFLKANREHPIIYATGLVDLNAKLVIDLVKGNAAKDLRNWCASSDQDWLKAIKVVATDLAESYRAGLSPHLDHAVRGRSLSCRKGRQPVPRHRATAGAERAPRSPGKEGGPALSHPQAPIVRSRTPR